MKQSTTVNINAHTWTTASVANPRSVWIKSLVPLVCWSNITKIMPKIRTNAKGFNKYVLHHTGQLGALISFLYLFWAYFLNRTNLFIGLSSSVDVLHVHPTSQDRWTNYRTIAHLTCKQDPSSDHMEKDPSEDRNGNCKWTGRIRTRKGDKRSNHESKDTDAQGSEP